MKNAHCTILICAVNQLAKLMAVQPMHSCLWCTNFMVGGETAGVCSDSLFICGMCIDF
jgi:hypothetical protein